MPSVQEEAETIGRLVIVYCQYFPEAYSALVFACTCRYRHSCRHHQLPAPTGENSNIQPGPGFGPWLQPPQGIDGHSKLPSRHASWVTTGSRPCAKNWCPNVEKASGGLGRSKSRPDWTCKQDWKGQAMNTEDFWFHQWTRHTYCVYHLQSHYYFLWFVT